MNQEDQRLRPELLADIAALDELPALVEIEGEHFFALLLTDEEQDVQVLSEEGWRPA